LKSRSVFKWPENIRPSIDEAEQYCFNFYELQLSNLHKQISLIQLYLRWDTANRR